MSTLWKDEVLEVAGQRAVLRLVLAHPDAGPFSTSPAFYTIEVTHPSWLAHLSVGQKWRSAAYD